MIFYGYDQFTKELLLKHQDCNLKQFEVAVNKTECFDFVFNLINQDIFHKPESGLKLNILIVDDSLPNRIIANKYFSHYCELCDLAESGSRAIDLVNNHSYDLIVMDIQMPDIDGIETAHMIREYEKTNSLAPSILIFLSGNSDDESLKSNYQLDEVGLVTKPLNLDKVKYIISLYQSKKST